MHLYMCACMHTIIYINSCNCGRSSPRSLVSSLSTFPFFNSPSTSHLNFTDPISEVHEIVYTYILYLGNHCFSYQYNTCKIKKKHISTELHWERIHTCTFLYIVLSLSFLKCVLLYLYK